MYRDQDIPSSNQSLRILSNLVAAGAIHASGLLDEIIHELLVFTATVVSLKSSEVNDLKAKVRRFIYEIVDFDTPTSSFAPLSLGYNYAWCWVLFGESKIIVCN